MGSTLPHATRPVHSGGEPTRTVKGINMRAQLVAGAILFSLVLGVASAACIAASYPERTVRFIVPYSPGGGTDIIGRVLAQKMTQLLGKTSLVDNRPGGGGMIGADI